MQDFYADDPLAFPVYQRAQDLGIPILFHAGMSWEPGSRLKYGHPLRFEDVAADFPKLNIVLAHLAWPWVVDAVALALKYPNVYLDTSALYFDNPRDFLTLRDDAAGSAHRVRAQPAQTDCFRIRQPAHRDQDHGEGGTCPGILARSAWN